MDIHEFYDLLIKVDDGYILNEEDANRLDNKANELVELLINGLADAFEQEQLKLYVLIFEKKYEKNNLQNKIILKYNSFINQRELVKSEMGEVLNKPKTLKMKPINSDGIISAITIIELVVVGGLIIAFLTLALLKK